MQGNFQCSTNARVRLAVTGCQLRRDERLGKRSCMMQIKQHLLDKRVIKRALQEGLLDKAAYQRTLDELPDLSHRVQTSDEPAAPAPSQAHEAAPSGNAASSANSY
jgi:hypothetical protein